MTSTTIDITEARKNFNRLDEQARDGHFIEVTRHGKPVFAVVDTEFLSSLLETIEIMSDKDSYEMFMNSLDDIRHGRLHDHDDVKKELLGDGNE